MDKLQALKTRLGTKDYSKDDDLVLLLEDAKNFILGYTRRSEKQWLPFFDSIQVKIAVIDYNREGAEGLISRGEGGISTGFLGVTDYPDSIIKPLNPHRLVKGIGKTGVN